MIAFQNIKTGEFLSSRTDWTHCQLLSDAYPFHQNDEKHMRETYPLKDYRTVNYSSRIDHPMNDLAKLTREQLAARYPI